jgi:hypothetical protein
MAATKLMQKKQEAEKAMAHDGHEADKEVVVDGGGSDGR